jgi:CelD/BcsL family acetyltransferase involved in cellulose biosynthesis
LLSLSQSLAARTAAAEIESDALAGAPDAQILHPSELSGEDTARWRALCAAEPAFQNPLLGPDFAQAVGEVRPDARVAIFVRDGSAVGFLPFHRRPGGLARPIGAPLSDYHALVSTPDIGLSGPALLAAAGLGAYRYTGLVDPFGLFGAPERARESYRVVPAGPAEDYLEGLRAASAKKFKNWRRLDHKLDREVAPLRLVAPETERAAFDTLIAWKRDQLKRTGGHDFLSPIWTRRLFEALFERREGDFQGLLIALYAGEKLVAAHFGVRLGDWYHPWLAATEPELAIYSPGQVFLIRAIGGMQDLGLATYDLGPGHDHYKRAFAPEPFDVGEGLAVAPTIAGAAHGAVDQAWALAGARQDTAFAARLRRRLEIITASETSLVGRTRGLADAVAGQARRRLNPVEAD